MSSEQAEEEQIIIVFRPLSACLSHAGFKQISIYVNVKNQPWGEARTGGCHLSHITICYIRGP